MKTSRYYSLSLAAILTMGGLMLGSGTAQAEPVTIDMWHFAANKEPVYQEWIAAYKDVAPDVTIRTNVIPKKAYNQAIAAAMISGTPPALIHGLPLGEPLELWGLGQIEDLTPSVDEEWRSVLYPSTIDSLTIDGRILSMSFATNNAQVLYNKDAFAQAGIEAPIQTMDDFRAAVEALRGNGYQGALYWAQANDHAPTLFIDWAQQMYPDMFAAADRGEGDWDTPEFVALMDEINSYNDVWAKGVASLSLDESINLFASGEIPMYIIGNWAVNSIAAANPTFEVGTFPVPALNDQTKPAALGSMAGTWMVSSQASDQQKQASIAFLRWVSMNQQERLVRAIGLCPAGPIGESALADAKPVAQQLCSEQVGAISRDMFDRPARDAMAGAIQGMINGQATPEQVMEAAQNARR